MAWVFARALLALCIFLCAAAEAAKPNTCGEAIFDFYRKYTKPRPDTFPVDVDTFNENYVESFSPLLDNKTFQDWLGARKKGGKKTNVLELAGSATFLGPNLDNVDSVTGIRLAPKVVPGMVKSYPNDKWREVPGNLFERDTWDRLARDREDRKIPDYDLVVCRPVGAVHMFSSEKYDEPTRRARFTAYHVVLDRAWRQLSTDDGMMLVEVPYPITQTGEFQKWLQVLKRDGIDVTYLAEDIHRLDAKSDMERENTSHAIRLRRTSKSPVRLPTLPPVSARPKVKIGE